MNTQNHEAWLAGILQRMDAVKPGMTRADLLKVFRTGGQPSREMLALARLHRTFISRDCPYFKVDVEFEPTAHPEWESRRLNRRLALRIVEISSRESRSLTWNRVPPTR
jgi:hypothetical protein